MERWLKPAVAAAPVDEQKVVAQVAAVRAEMTARWDAIATRDAMLRHVENWLAYGAADAGVKGCLPRETLHVVMAEIYQEKFPEDFVPVDVKPVVIGEAEPK